MIRAELAPRLRALAHRVEVQNILRPGGAAAQRPTLSDIPRALPLAAPLPLAAAPVSSLPRLAAKPELVVVGVSTGGPNALSSLLAALPRDLGVPILIVQHMPPIFTQVLATNLSMKSSVPVVEGKQDEDSSQHRLPRARRKAYASGARPCRREAAATVRRSSGELLPAGGGLPVPLGGQTFPPRRWL